MSVPNTHNKKLLIITYYWPPAGGPGVQRWLKFTRYLPEFGFDPVILTVDEEQASYALRDESLRNDVLPGMQIIRTPTRELYSLYLKLTGRKNIPFSGFVKESKPDFRERFIRFIRTHFFIPDPRKGWNHFALRKSCEIIRTENIKYILTTSPPHSTQLIGLHLKKKFPALKWIADFRDPWTRIFFFNELSHSIYSSYRHRILEERVLKNSDNILVVSPSMKKEFYKDHPACTPEKIMVLPNGYDENDFTEKNMAPDAEFTITYTGTLAPNYRIDSLAEAIAAINRKGENIVRLCFVGEVCEKYRNLLQQRLKPEEFELVPPVAHDKSIEYLRRSHMFLLVIPDAPDNRAIITGKLFEYLGIGPAEGDAALFLQRIQQRSMHGYDSIEEIKKDILDQLKIFNKTGTCGLTYDFSGYSRKNLTKSIAAIFNDISVHDLL